MIMLVKRPGRGGTPRTRASSNFGASIISELGRGPHESVGDSFSYARGRGWRR